MLRICHSLEPHTFMSFDLLTAELWRYVEQRSTSYKVTNYSC